MGKRVEERGLSELSEEKLTNRTPIQQTHLAKLHWDRPRVQWPHEADGVLTMFTRRLDIEGLLKELDVPA